MKYRNYMFIFTLMFLGLFSCNQQSKKTENSINFKWREFNQNGIKIKHGAMIVPVKLENIEKQFEMQFDLGLDVNAIYENALNSILIKYPNFKNNVSEGNGYRVYKTKTYLDKYKSAVDSLLVIKNKKEKTDYKDLETIGSIGSNEIENKILIIDFPNQQLSIKKKLNNSVINQFKFVPLEYKKRKIILTLNVNNTYQKYIFDTGASLTAITTIDENFFNLVKGESNKSTDTLYLDSWGEKISLIGGVITTPIKLANKQLNITNKKIYYTKSKSINKTLKQNNVKGLIGNDLFINNIIVIDLVNNRFGINK